MPRKKSPILPETEAAPSTETVAKQRERATGPANHPVATARLNQVASTIWLPENLDPGGRSARIEDVILSLTKIEPQDEFERMLVSQMIACHHASMECYRRAMFEGQSFEGREINLRHAGKLSATFAKLLETFNKHRGKGQQKVTVEHIHVEAGAQAIVGNVDTGSGVATPAGRRKVAPPQLEHQVPFPVDALAPSPARVKAGSKTSRG